MNTFDLQDETEEQQRGYLDDDNSGFPKKSHHQEIREIANRIKSSVKTLYKPKKAVQEEDKDKRQQKDASAPTTPKAQLRQSGLALVPEENEKKPIQAKAPQKQIQVDVPQDESDQDEDDASPISKPAAARQEGSSSSDEGDMGTVLGFDGLVDDYDPEEWDMGQSKAAVDRLVGALKASKRTEVMHRLNTWFSSKANEIKESNDDLAASENEVENDASLFYVGSWSAGKSIERGIEEKEVRSIKTLNKFYKSLRGQIKQRRPKLAKASAKKQLNKASIRTSQRSADEEEDQEEEEQPEFAMQNDEDENRFLGNWKGLHPKELRERLQAKEAEIRDLITEGEESAAEGGHDSALVDVTTDLMEVISKQQEDLADLQVESEVSVKKLQTAKQCLAHLTAAQVQGEENVPQPDKAISKMLIDLENQIREERTRNSLEGQKTFSASSEAEKAQLDNEDEDEIQRQVDELRQLIKDTEAQIEDLKASGMYDTFGKATEEQMETVADETLRAELPALSSPTPISAPGSKESVAPSPQPSEASSPKKGAAQKVGETAKENAQKLETEISRFDRLIPIAEAALAKLDGYRQAFAAADAESNKILFEDVAELNETPLSPQGSTTPVSPLSNPNVDKSGLLPEEAPTMSESERQELLSNESLVQEEYNRHEKALEQKKNRIQEEMRKQGELKVNIDDFREKIKELSKQLESPPNSVEACEAEINKFQSENQRLELKIADLQKEIQAEARRAQIEAQKAAETSGDVEGGNESDEGETPDGGLPEESEEQGLPAGSPGDKSEVASPVVLASNPAAGMQERRAETTKNLQQADVNAMSGTAEGEVPEKSVDSTSDRASKEGVPSTALSVPSAGVSVAGSSVAGSPVAGSPVAASPLPKSQNSSNEASRSSNKQAPASPHPEAEATASAPVEAPSKADVKKEAAKTQQQQDMAELMQLQQENVEITDQIDEIEAKIKALQKARQKSATVDIQEVLGTKEEKPEEPPPEVLDLRKEMRKKQRALNALRKRWWNEKSEGQAARKMAGQKQVEEVKSARQSVGEEKQLARRSQLAEQFEVPDPSYDSKSHEGLDHDAAVHIAAVPAHVHFNRVRLSLGGLGVGVG